MSSSAPEAAIRRRLYVAWKKIAPIAPAAQTILLATQLAKARKEFGVLVLPGENHKLQRHRVERDRQMVEFFRRYLFN
jgi:dipeptidyl aminopeptidase/acylaminoacyl peptidase